MKVRPLTDFEILDLYELYMLNQISENNRYKDLLKKIFPKSDRAPIPDCSCNNQVWCLEEKLKIIDDRYACMLKNGGDPSYLAILRENIGGQQGVDADCHGVIQLEEPPRLITDSALFFQDDPSARIQASGFNVISRIFNRLLDLFGFKYSPAKFSKDASIRDDIAMKAIQYISI